MERTYQRNIAHLGIILALQITKASKLISLEPATLAAGARVPTPLRIWYSAVVLQALSEVEAGASPVAVRVLAAGPHEPVVDAVAVDGAAGGGDGLQASGGLPWLMGGNGKGVNQGDHNLLTFIILGFESMFYCVWGWGCE